MGAVGTEQEGARLHNNSMKISEKLVQAYGTVTDALERYGKPAFHYGLIPLIIVVGMTVKQDGRREAPGAGLLWPSFSAICEMTAGWSERTLEAPDEKRFGFLLPRRIRKGTRFFEEKAAGDCKTIP